MQEKIDKNNVEDLISLSSTQEGLLYHYLSIPDSLQYIEQLSISIGGCLDVQQIKNTWKIVVENNQLLRTVFRWQGLDKPIQIVLKKHEVPITLLDLTDKKEFKDPEAFLSDIKEADRRKNIDISQEPFRVTLVKREVNLWEMIITNHHILYDGWSTGILLKEFFQTYENLTIGENPIKLKKSKFREFINWCKNRDSSEEKKYWEKYLENFDTVTTIPGNNKLKEFDQGIQTKVIHNISNSLVKDMKQFCQQKNITLATLLYTAWGILLGKYTNSEDVVFGTTISGRPPEIKGIEEIVGLFINTLPLRINNLRITSVDKLLVEVDLILKERTAYENTPLVDIQQYSKLINTQLFNNIVVIENYPMDQMLKELKGSIKVRDFSMVEQTNYDLTLGISILNGIQLSILHNGKYDYYIINNLLKHYEGIITSILDSPHQKINELDFLDREDKELLINTFNDTNAEYPSEKTLHQLFEEQVERTPEKIAVIYKENTLSYREVNEKANQLANALVKKGIQSDSIVGIMLNPSLEMMIGILGILKAGGAYLPIDSGYPVERIKYMLEDSGAEILLTESTLANQMQLEDQLIFNGEFISIDNPQIYVEGTSNLPTSCNSQNLAYIIYTSGSTGKPKGVMVQHNNVVNVLTALEKDYPLLETDVYLLKTTFTFDVSVTELFGWFVGDGKLVILPKGEEKDPKAIGETISKNKITHINFVPSMLKVFTDLINEDEKENLKSLKYIFAAGEAISKELVEAVHRKIHDVRLENIYGPTEITIYATKYSIMRDEIYHNIPIGKPMVNTKAYILDGNNQLQPVGVPGELCIAGAGVTRGYINRPELTAEKFIENPFIPGEKMYRTGDLVRWLADGNIEFLGRIDHQVKIRGYRIEIGEIENQLLAVEGIKEGVVLVKEDRGGAKYLSAYVMIDKELTVSEIRGKMAEIIPDYMIPSYITLLEEIPLTANGKVDRRALPEEDGNISGGVEYQAPRNEIEGKLVKIWEEILGVKGIGIYHDFFEMGGHSLKATTMVGKIYKIFNVEIPLRDIFKATNIEKMGRLIQSTEKKNYLAIKEVEPQEYYVTSSAQKRLYTLYQLDQDNIGYNMPGALVLEGSLDINRVEAVLGKLIERHEALRTSIGFQEGEPVQYIHETIEFNLQYMEAKEEELGGILKDIIKPFDLGKAPLLRAGLVKVLKEVSGTEKYLLFFDMHHIISDGVTMSILTKEFAELYKGNKLESLRIQYKDYSHWQRSLVTSGKIEDQKGYWLQQFEGEIPLLNLLGDYPRPANQSFAGDLLTYRLEDALTSGLRQLCKETGATLYMVLLSAFNVLLSKYSGQEDIIVGSPIAGRPHGDLSNIIGMFVNTLAMRNYPKASKTFKEFLVEVKENALGAYQHQGYQFEELVENLNLRRDFSRNPLFDVMFTMQNTEVSDLALEGLIIKPYELINKVSKFDITLLAEEKDHGIDIALEYATKIFKKETIEKLYRHLRNIISQIIHNPDLKLCEIQLVTEEEKQQLLEDFNNTRADYPRNKTVHQIFEEQVEKTPEHGAVVYGNMSLTYRQLNEKSNQVARQLVEMGVKKDTLVGIMVERSLEMIIGIMGILKAGGAYVPIDPSYPADRIQYMLEDSGSEILLTQSCLMNSMTEAVAFNRAVIALDHEDLYKGEDSNLTLEYTSDSLAYVIYTSGSTGNPKGVMIQHYSLVNRLNWMQNNYPLGEGDIILQKTPFTFDVSLWEIFWWSMAGAKVYMLEQGGEKDPSKLLEAIEKNNISIMHFVPSMLSIFLEHLETNQEKYGLSSLRKVFSSGEALTKHQVEKFNQFISSKYQCSLSNLYGPTEATVDVSYFDCEGTEGLNSIPIGKPIDNINLYILDQSLKLQPIGVAGELCIGGDGLARGYLNRPELTAEKFVENPYRAGEKIYRTGDLARWLPNGNVEYLGRIDFQVKIRGYRIELGEIENRLQDHDGIKDVVVVDQNDQEGNKYLCGYIVTTGDEVTIQSLREHLAKDLPDYMIPSYFVQLQKMPLTSNGKVDRKALPQPDENILSVVEYTAPENEIEVALVEIWQEILGVEGIGTNHNFFEIGGHSLKATAMMAKISKNLQVEIPLKEIFATPTIKAIGGYIKSAEKTLYSTIEAVEEKENYPASPAQRRLYTLQQLDQDSIGYNMPGAVVLEGSLEVEKIEKAFEKLLERHEALRTSFKMVEGDIVQYIHKAVDFKFQYMEVDELSIGEILQRFAKPFDLSQAPLLRVGFGRISDEKIEKHLLVFDMHHIISDGTSMGILIKEFAELYQGMNLEPLNIQYKDYSVWQNNLISSKTMEKQKKYWLRQFEGEIPVLNLMGDYPRPAIQSFEGHRLKFNIEEGLTNKLRKFSTETGTTMYMVLLSALNVVLSKYTGQEDIIVGSTIAGRSHGDLNNIMGMFVNTLAMRNHPVAAKTFKEFLMEVRTNALGAYENQDYQFEELLEHLNIKRDISRNPLFDVMFTMQNMDLEELSIKGLSVKPYELENNIAKFDITLFVNEGENNINVDIEYATRIFKQETMERFYRHLEHVLGQIVANEDMLLSDIQLITEEEKKHLMLEFNNTKAPYPEDQVIHQLFEAQVAKNPDVIAVSFEDSCLTYGELNQRANQVARRLRAKGVGPDEIVGIMMERSLELVVGVMAVLKAGGAYMPIAPDYPDERKRYMLENSHTKILLTQSDLRKEIDFNGAILLLDQQEIYEGEDSNLDIINQPQDLAYVLFTSGTTGKPKGVMIQHSGSLNTLTTLQKQFPILEGDSYLLKTNYCFDVSVIELFAWFVKEQGKLVILKPFEEREPKKIINIIKKEKITHINFVPSMMQVFVDSINEEVVDDLASLKYVILGGEAVTKDLAQRFYGKIGNFGVSLENIYGPTENSIYCSRYAIPREENHGSVPIGTPVPNIQIYILNGYKQQQPIGVPGELCIGGAGLGRGYLNRPELTVEKFIDHPFVEGERMYRTGDLARWLPDGNIEYLGRIDHQVKIRGYRIELGEIENALLKQESIKETLVMVREDRGGNKYLCGYIVAESEINIASLKQDLLNEIPEYMVPQFIIQLDEMPLTPNGKINRKALPESDEKILTMAEYEAPRSKVEETLVAIWQEILGVEGIGISHNFFELGGHSLKATVLMSRIHKTLNKEIPLKELFKSPTIKGLSQFIEGENENQYLKIEKAKQKHRYTASSAQKRMYILQQLDKTSIAYNMPVAFVLEGEVNKEKIEGTFQQLISRHEALRTYFETSQDEIFQRIADEWQLNVPERKDDREIQTIIKEFVRPFDLDQKPLLRVELVESKGQYFLLIDMHHIISDGVSVDILIKEFVEIYRGGNLKPLKLQYKDFTEWQNNFLKTGELKKQEDFWMNQFEGEVPVLTLPYDYERPAMQSFEGSGVSFKIDEERTKAIRKLTRDTGTTLHMVILSAFTILLSKYSGLEDIVVGTPIAGRPHADLHGIMGMFVNTLALRNKPEGKKKYREFLEEVKVNSLKAYENQNYQLEALVEKLGVGRDTSRNPLFDVMFNMVDTVSTKNIQLDALSLRHYEVGNSLSKFDLTLNGMEEDQGLAFTIDYSSKLFKKATIEAFGQRFIKVLDSILANADGELGEIQWMTDIEKNQILNINNTATDYAKSKTIQMLFEEQVEKNPDNVAVVFEDKSLTYGELNEKSNLLARTIRSKGVKANSIVGIMAEKSLELVVGILAILKSGAGYLPIDPSYPVERSSYMLEDSDSQILITTSNLMEGIVFSGEILDLHDAKLYVGESSNLEGINTPSDLACIIYTSGTTGLPKGVMCEHKNIVRLINNTNYIEFQKGDRLLQTVSIAFDVSNFEIWGSLLNGIELYLAKNETIILPDLLHNFINKNNITLLWLTSELFNQIAEAKVEVFKNLSCLLVGGDVLSPKYINLIRREFKDLKIINGYGPTENGTFSTTYQIEKEYPTSIPVGKPIANSTTYIVDQNLNLVPIGVYGELCVGGEGLARGYLNRPELTAEKFVDNPFVVGTKMYKTGDLARWLPDGNIEFLGRKDNQVKIRGFRIELGEIEHRILQHEGIKEVAVLVSETHNKDKCICAYIVSEKDLEELNLKSYLKETLPEYMIPTFFMKVEKMPLSSNGKLDRKKLPAPSFEGNFGHYEAPTNVIEKTLAKIWEEVLDIDEIGINDNFFELGGHSLKATVVVSKIHKELNREIPLKELFKLPTIKELSRFIEATEETNYSKIEMVEKQEYYEVSSAQKRLYMLNQFDQESRAYNMYSEMTLMEEIDIAIVKRVLATIANRHEAFRTKFKEIDGEVVQIIEDEVELNLDIVDLSHLEAEAQKNKLKELYDEYSSVIFDLGECPLVAVKLVKIKETEFNLILTMHHIITDGYSMEILKNEFYSLYKSYEKGEDLNIESAGLQYKDFAAWQNRLIKSDQMTHVKDYWRNQLMGELQKLNLPYHYSHGDVNNRQSAIYRMVIKEEFKEKLKEISTENNASLFTVLLTTFKSFLADLTGQADILIGTAGFGRNHVELENVVGYFVNTVILRNRIDKEETFIGLLKGVNSNTMKALEYQYYPLELVTDELNIKYPKLSVFFNMLNMGTSNKEHLQDLESYHIEESQEAKFDLVWYVTEYANGIEVTCHYISTLFKPSIIEGMMGQYMKLLEYILNNPEKQLKQYRASTKRRRI